MASLADGVRRVATTTAHAYAAPLMGASPGSSSAGGGSDAPAGGASAAAHYVGLLEEALSGALGERDAAQQLVHELEAKLYAERHADAARNADVAARHADACSATAATGTADDGVDEAAAAALAAAEAAADALFASDRALLDHASPAAGTAALDSENAVDVGDAYARAACTPGGAGAGAALGVGGGVEAACGELRQRAAAAALLEELRLEGAKSHRLERIISKLMSELRNAKLHAASGHATKISRASFADAGTRLQAALADNAAGLRVLDGTLRTGLDAAAARLRALEGTASAAGSSSTARAR